MRHLFIAATVFCLVLLGMGRAAMAEDPAPEFINSFGSWKVYSFLEASGSKVCFMASAPQEQKGKFKKRDAVQFFVTRWMSEKNKDIVSVAMGYPIKEKSTLIVRANGKTFELFAKDEMAWAKDSATDQNIVKALREGKQLVVEGISTRETKTEDTYSLKGVSAAYAELTKACTN